MREILFRGRTSTGKWIYGSLIWIDGEHIFIGPKYEGASTMSCAELITTTMKYVEPNTIGQYTGLTDINGTQIYEGDILQNFGADIFCGKYNFLVEYVDGILQATSDCVEAYADDFHNLRIIGNIHDNPELLEAVID